MGPSWSSRSLGCARLFLIPISFPISGYLGLSFLACVFWAVVEQMTMAELEHALLCCCVLLVTVVESPTCIVTFLSSLGASSLTDLHAPFTV